MYKYGQYCPVAKASEILTERYHHVPPPPQPASGGCQG